MNITTVKQQENGYLVNDSMSVPNSPSNRHYVMVQEWIAEGGVVDPEFTVQELDAKNKAEAKQLALTEFNETIATITGNTPKVESDSWPKQEIEARDLTKQTLLIDQLIIDRVLGETREQLAAKIIANADAYAPLYAKALGVYQAKIKALV